MTRKEKPTDAEFNAYLDGELSPEESAALAEWLAAHPDDAAKVAGLRRVGEAIRARYAPVAEEPVPDAIGAIIAGRPQRESHPVWAQSAAAILLLLTGGIAGFLLGDYLNASGRERFALVSSAVGAHAVYVTEVRHPVEVGANEEQHLVKWLTKRIGAPVRAPVLTDQKFQLMGGRLLPHNGRPAAQFMYEDDSGRRLTLYVRQAGKAENTAFQFEQQAGLQAFYWIDRPLAYAIVAELPREELLTVARKIYEQLN